MDISALIPLRLAAAYPPDHRRIDSAILRSTCDLPGIVDTPPGEDGQTGYRRCPNSRRCES